MSAVSRVFTAVAACGLCVGGADAGHVLPHRAYVIVLGGVVVEVVVMEWIRFVARTLFQMEAVVLDVSLHAGLVHEAVVLFRAIAGVGDGDRGQMSVAVKEGVEERYQCQCVGGIGEQGKVGDELVFGRDLKIVSRLGLAVVHGVFLHAHERGVGVGLGHGVALADLFKTAVIFLELVAMLLQFLYLLLLSATLLLLLIIHRGGLCRECVFEFTDKGIKGFGSELHRLRLCSFILRYNLVYLLQKDAYFLL